MNKLFVIKIGGNVLDDPSALKKFLSDFASIQTPKILIHGGGKIATRIGDQLGIRSNYVGGRRITDQPTRDLVTMVYGGLINKQIVATLQGWHCNAMGVTGADGNLIRVWSFVFVGFYNHVCHTFGYLRFDLIIHLAGTHSHCDDGLVNRSFCGFFHANDDGVDDVCAHSGLG